MAANFKAWGQSALRPTSARALFSSVWLALVGTSLGHADACLAGETLQPRTLYGMAGAVERPQAQSQPSPPAPQVASDDAGAQLYAAAERELSRGRTSEAQRLLEQVVVLAPDSVSAWAARGRLANLYASAPKPLSNEVVLSHLGAPKEAAQPQPATLVGPSVGSSPWQTEIRREATPDTARPEPRKDSPRIDARSMRALQDEFRFSAGDRVFFSSGSAELGSSALLVVHAQARYLKLHPELYVGVTGHADEPGSVEANVQLSATRAAGIVRILLADGIDAERVAARGAGQAEPVAPCPDPSCAAQNRRAVAELSAESFAQAEAGLGLQGLASVAGAPVTGAERMRPGRQIALPR